MDLKRLADKAKQIIDQRGGPGSVKEDAAEVQNIMKGEGSLSDKAKKAAEALKEPGAHKEPETGPAPGQEPAAKRPAGQEPGQ